jgi:hypothetical protein
MPAGSEMKVHALSAPNKCTHITEL